MLLRVLTFLLVSSVQITVRAEYRAFELTITDQTTGAARKVITNLDNLQYRGYYPVKSTEEIEISDTWMCKGRTDNYKRYCPSPNRAPAQAPR